MCYSVTSFQVTRIRAYGSRLGFGLSDFIKLIERKGGEVIFGVCSQVLLALPMVAVEPFGASPGTSQTGKRKTCSLHLRFLINGIRKKCINDGICDSFSFHSFTFHH